MASTERFTCRAAGVDIDALDELIERIKPAAGGRATVIGSVAPDPEQIVSIV